MHARKQVLPALLPGQPLCPRFHCQGRHAHRPKCSREAEVSTETAPAAAAAGMPAVASRDVMSAAGWSAPCTGASACDWLLPLLPPANKQWVHWARATTCLAVIQQSAILATNKAPQLCARFENCATPPCPTPAEAEAAPPPLWRLAVEARTSTTPAAAAAAEMPWREECEWRRLSGCRGGRGGSDVVEAEIDWRRCSPSPLAPCAAVAREGMRQLCGARKPKQGQQQARAAA